MRFSIGMKMVASTAVRCWFFVTATDQSNNPGRRKFALDHRKLRIRKLVLDQHAAVALVQQRQNAVLTEPEKVGHKHSLRAQVVIKNESRNGSGSSELLYFAPIATL